MKSIIALIISIFIPLALYASPDQTEDLMSLDNAELLNVLDRTLADKDKYEQDKKDKIAHLHEDMASATDDEQRYWIARNLYNEYRTYDSDSAFVYVEMSLDLATKVNRQKWIDEMNICRSYIYAATGLFAEAKNSIDKIDPATLDRNLYLKYNEQRLFLYTHKDQYLSQSTEEFPYTTETIQLLDSITQNLPQSDPSYCWFIGWHGYSSEAKSREAIPYVLSVVEKSDFSTIDDAKNAWILSRLYKNINDNKNKERFLILSSIADIRTSNKEIASLEEVAHLMFERNDLVRANEYVTYCINCADAYKSRIRVAKLADLQHKITVAFKERSDNQSQTVQLYFIALITIVVLLIATLIFSITQNRKLRNNRAALNDVNEKLNQQIEEQARLQAQIKDTNEQLVDANEKLQLMYSDAKQSTIALSETNYSKERYIADIFSICSNYISKLDDFRRNIYHMLLAHRYEDLKELTKSQELSASEIKELYSNFDKIFLGIYPDFVRDFNTLLRPEEQITLKKGELLNTELRIYALVRLGLNDSTKIAQFLHCSVRTVYNTRQRIRNKAIIPKDEFADTVKSLGKTAY